MLSGVCSHIGDGVLAFLRKGYFSPFHPCRFGYIRGWKMKGGTGIRTQGNGFANRGLSPLGDAATNYLHERKRKCAIISSGNFLGKEFFKRLQKRP